MTLLSCVRSKRHRLYWHYTHIWFRHVDVFRVHTETSWKYIRVLSACQSLHTPPQLHLHITTTTTTTTTTTRSHNESQPSNLDLQSIQHGKTHQIQTEQGLTDSSLFVVSVVLHDGFLSFWSDLSGYYLSRQTLLSANLCQVWFLVEYHLGQKKADKTLFSGDLIFSYLLAN